MVNVKIAKKKPDKDSELIFVPGLLIRGAAVQVKS